MSERCWTLLGTRDAVSGTWTVRLDHTVVGGETRVDADWSWTMEREESQRDVAGFFHTHPEGCGTGPSERDVRTMQAWCSAFGKPLLCLIAEDGSAEVLSAHLFTNDEDTGAPAASLEKGAAGNFTIKER